MGFKNSMIVAAVATAGVLAGCGGSGSDGEYGAMSQNAKGGNGKGQGGGSTPTPSTPNSCSGLTNVDADAPSVSVVQRDATTFTLDVAAGASGAVGGFTLEWAPANQVVNGVWPTQPCNQKFIGVGQGNGHPENALQPGAHRVIDRTELTGAGAACQPALDCGTEYVFRAIAKNWPDNVACINYRDSDYSAGVNAVCAPEEEQPPETVRLEVTKFYDANENGMLDQEDEYAVALGYKPVQIAGWHFEVLDGYGTVVAYGETPAGGQPLVFDLPPVVYTVREVMPNETNWFATTDMSQPADLTYGPATLWFGNACNLSPGGHTRGYWQNPNGAAEFTADDLTAMQNLWLRDNNGASFDPATYAAFRTWIRNANAKNMTFQLSAQLASTVLGIRHDYTDASIYVGRDAYGNWLDVNDLVAYSDGLLENWTQANAANTRASEDWAKSLLDEVNNGHSFTQPSYAGCTATWNAPVVLQ